MPNTRADRHRTTPGCAPDATCFLAVSFSLRRRRKGWCLRSSRPSRCGPRSHFSITFFRWLEANRAERETGQGRAFWARSSERTRRPLTRLPRSVHSPAKKWEILPLLSFQHVYARSPRGCSTATRNRRFSFLAACFLQVHAREPGNRPFFAVLPRSSLIPHALTYVNRRFLCSSHLGVTCPPSTPCAARQGFDLGLATQLGGQDTLRDHLNPTVSSGFGPGKRS